MDESPYISVVIPAYNEELLIAATLDSVHSSFEKTSGTVYEIVVCDNNSSDPTPLIAATHGARMVFEAHNQISRARNTGAKAARGQWLIFLDADTLLNPATLGATLALIKSNSVGAGGALLKLDDEKLASWLVMVVYGWNQVSRFLKLAAGSYLFCRRDAWEATGGFDERYYASEEIWFSRKLKKWCRANGLKFAIISSDPIITSARKLKWYTPGQLLKQFAVLLIPGTWRNRNRCATWYRRPSIR